MRYWLLCLVLAGCSRLPVEPLPSQSFNGRVQFLVLHFTAEHFQGSVDALVHSGLVSSHYLIPQPNDPTYPYGKLKIFQLVAEKDRAWHAGASQWQGRSNLNDQSIGIEIVNQPSCEPPPYPLGRRQCQYPDFAPAQMALVQALAKDILARYPDIGPTQVVGHADIAPSRKDDPGPRFPWFELYQAGVGAWYDDADVSRFSQQFSAEPPSLTLVQQALAAYGYGLAASGEPDRRTQDCLLAFQMHFLPWHLSGQADLQTAAALFALLDKYFPDKAATLLAGG